VRKLAQQNGVDLASVTGTGVGGRIRKQDVLAAAEAAKAPAATARAPGRSPEAAAAPSPRRPAEPSAKRGTTEKLNRLRAVIAKRMVESLQTAAQLTATVEVDLTNISKLRAKVKDAFKAREGASLSYLPFIALAAVEGLKQFPVVNAEIDTDGRHDHLPDAEHLGIAVDTDRGLLVPVIKDAGDLNVTGLAKKIGDWPPARGQQGHPGRAVRRHVHHHQLRLGRHPVRHPDHQPAAVGHPGHRRAREAPMVIKEGGSDAGARSSRCAT
jgi:pyruvate dehydrogenase E2 component (dihydrolipoamide acetyltransferase)